MKAISSLVIIVTFLVGAFAPSPKAGGDWPTGARDQLKSRGVPESVAELRLPSPRMVTS